MPKLYPIRALRYAAPDGRVGRFIAPPYDVLDEAGKQALLAIDPHNIVAVDLPVTPPKTLGPDAAYDAAGKRLGEWVASGVLKRDEQPAVFAYEQVYKAGDKTIRRRGLFAGLGVEDFGRKGGGIHRHELTIKGGTDDRLKLMNATHAQLSPVFGFFDDAGRKVDDLIAPWIEKRAPDAVGLTAHDHVEHRLWKIDDTRTIAALAGVLHDSDVFIADGHHRYHTALNYRREHPDSPAAQACLFVLVAEQDPGLVVLPTHRVVKGLAGFSMTKLADVLKADGRFKLEATYHGGDGLPHMPDELPRHGPHALGLYSPESGRTFALSATRDDPLAELMPDRAAVWRRLDVAVLHHLFIDRVLKPNFGGEAISYSYPHQLTELVKQVHDEPGRLGVVMQPTPLRAVRDVSMAGEVMPPKSTFFFPKLATGLVINPLD
jgi:uncharacterized protein (DUF1015 family)